MDRNLLILMDDTVRWEDLAALIDCKKRNRIVVCYTGIRAEQHLKTEFGKIKGEVVFYPFAKKFRETSFLLREQYIDFIALLGEKQIGKTDLKKHFKIPLRDISGWWFSLIAEKNPMKSNSLVTLCQFITTVNIVEENQCDEILLMKKNHVLATCLKKYATKKGLKFYSRNFSPSVYEILVAVSAVKSAFYNLCHIFKRSVILRRKMGNFLNRWEFLSSTPCVFFTYFPQVDRSAAREQRFVNKYFGPIQSGFEKKYGKAITWVLLQEQTSEFDEPGGICLAKKMKDVGYKMIFWEEFLFPSDFIRAIFLYLWLSGKFLIARNRIRDSSVFLKPEINVYPVFLKDWYQSFMGYGLLEGLLYLFAFERCLRCIKEKSIIIYPAENQAWEKSLCFAGKMHNLFTTGIQHTTVPVMMLNFFNDKREMCENSCVSCVPHPEILGCAGEICREMMLNAGWPDDRVFISGGVRFGYLKNALFSSTDWRNRKNSVVVALSIQKDESIWLLRFVAESFNGMKNLQIIVKGHPDLPARKLISSSDILLDADVFSVNDTEPLSTLLSDSKALVVMNSSSAVEGIGNLCAVFVPVSAEIIDINPFSWISGLVEYVESPSRLKHKIENILTLKEPYVSREKCQEFIKRYFTFYDNDRYYVELIENLRKNILKGL